MTQEDKEIDLSHYPGNYYCLYHTILTGDKRRCEEVEVYHSEKMADAENKRIEMVKNGIPSDTLIIYIIRKDWYDTGRIKKF